MSGYLSSVPVNDNERVAANQVVARIDGRDFATTLVQTRADIAAAEAAVAGKQASLDIQRSIIDGARATIAVDAANQVFAQQDDQRYAHLAMTGYGTVQDSQHAVSRIAAARATVAHDSAALATAVGQLDLLKAELAQARATLQHDEAAARQAELNLSYTTITASTAGVVGNRTLRVGQYVQARS